MKADWKQDPTTEQGEFAELLDQVVFVESELPVVFLRAASKYRRYAAEPVLGCGESLACYVS